MHPLVRLLPLTLLFVVFNCSALASSSSCTGYDCLQEYVFREDEAYSWYDTGHRIRVDGTGGRGGWTGYFLNFTSQQWLTSDLVSRSEWWHILVVVVPDNLSTMDTTLLWIGSGGNSDPLPDLADYDLLVAGGIATTNKVVTAALFQIPNANLVFAEDPEQASRWEDAAIAFTWWKFASDPSTDPAYILQLPMAKAGVRALDTVESFLTSATAPDEVQALGLTPTHHIVAGASKRGYSTWHVAAVDPRVMAIVPIVMDELNFAENVQHHYRSLGGWSFVLKDYWHMNLTMLFNKPEMQLIFDIVDPFVYREKINLPKLVCNTADDEFFLPDNIRWWWDKMPAHHQMNRFVTLPNSDHPTIPGTLELVGTVTTWLREILMASSRLGSRPAAGSIEERNAASELLMEAADVPKYNWTISATGEEITVTADRKPLAVTMWHSSTCHAHAHTRKDFRLVNIDSPCECGLAVQGYCANLAVAWVPWVLKETEPGSLTWVAHMPAPTGGQWTAFFVDLQFEGPEPSQQHGWPLGHDGTFEFTTAVSIVPDTFPVDECQNEECLGTLV